MSLVIHDEIEQGTYQWLQLRAGVPTASMFHAILAKGEGKTRRSYLCRLAAEIITGEPSETFVNQAMERGKRMEEEARDLYAFTTNSELRRVGFVRNGPKGCSPDSLIGNDGALEIKTQRGDLLIETILKNQFPSEHKAQCQGCLWVAEREWVDISIYWPNMPQFIKRAYRDDLYIRDLAAEVERFNAELCEMVERLRRFGQRAAA